MFDDVLLEHVGLPYVLPLNVHLRSFCWTIRRDHYEPFLLFEFYCGTPPSCLKVMVGGWVVVGGLQHYSVSPRPLGFGFLGFGAKGLDKNNICIIIKFCSGNNLKTTVPGRQGTAPSLLRFDQTSKHKYKYIT